MDREKKVSPISRFLPHTFADNAPSLNHVQQQRRGLSKLIERSKKSVNRKKKSIVVPITTERFVLGFTYDPSRVDFNLLYYNDSRPY